MWDSRDYCYLFFFFFFCNHTSDRLFFCFIGSRIGTVLLVNLFSAGGLVFCLSFSFTTVITGRCLVQFS
jgi:hypothetical protein